MVELLMDRKMLRGVVVGLCLLAVLSFAAGLVLGIRRSLPSRSSSATPETKALLAAPSNDAQMASEGSHGALFAATDHERVVLAQAALPGLSAALPDVRSPITRGAGGRAPSSVTKIPVVQAPVDRPVHPVEAAPAFDRQPPRVLLDADRRLSYTVQAGAFVSRVNAREQAQTLTGRGYETRVVGVRVASGRIFSLVLVGSYVGFSEAVRTAATLDAEGFSAFARSNVAGEESQAAPGLSG